MSIFTKKLKRQQGFTLIEMMVSVSIFVIVAFIVVSTLLTLSYAYKKAQKMRLLMDNFNFALQSMSINIREGINYQFPCGNSDCISFVSVDNWLQGNNSRICYSLDNKIIKKCQGICPCSSNSSNLTSPDISVEKLSFKFEQSSSARKLVKILINGSAGKNDKERTSFFIQNTIVQRGVDQTI